MDRSRIKNRLFGLSPKKVNAYLRQLKNLQDTEWRELEEKHKALQSEHDRLLSERDALQARLQRSTQAAEWQELAASRAEAAVRAMQLQTQQELNDLQRRADLMREEHEQKIERIEQQTEHYAQVLQELLQEFGQTMQKFNSSALELPSIEQTAASLAAKQQERLSKSDNVVQFRGRSTTERELINEALQRMGSAQTLDDEARADRIAVTEAASAVSPAAAEPEFDGQETSAFWGNIQSFVSSTVDVTLPAEAEASPPVPDEDEPEPAPQPYSVPATAVSSEQESEEGEVRESGALSAEIMSIRNRYIVGKAAGEDLYDANGRLIVAKSALITPEIVDLADQAGRLPDLIVNMKIPGMADEQTS